MKTMKICVYAICRNERKFTDSWMESMGEADEIHVLDTGSDDGTPERLAELGAKVHSASIVPWRFDEARNRSLDLVPLDADICVCTDLDERFAPGWREKLEQAWTTSATMAKYLYNWSLKPDGSPNVQMTYFKIHSRIGYKWVCPVHEVLVCTGERKHVEVKAEGVVLTHYPDKGKSRSYYLELLELGVNEDPTNERMAYYLGREHMYNQRWNDCISVLKKYLSLDSATWEDERSAAMRWIGLSYSRLGDFAQSRRWFLRAIAERPGMRDAYVEAAQMEYSQKNWCATLFFTTEALKIKEKSVTFVNQGYAWDHTLDDLASIACYKLGMVGESLKHAKAALSMNPTNERLSSNVQIIEKELNSAKP
jgi:glycosyltransferase involved in cell wall biosynthesis